MKASEKRRIIRELFRSMLKKALDEVPKMPDNWDGHEIREYLGDAWRNEQTQLMRNDRARAKSYRNDLLVHNIR